MSRDNFTLNGMEYASYATIAEADGFLSVATRYSTRWNALQAEEKQRLLVLASRAIDSHVSPYVVPDQVPGAIEQATILLAAHYAVDSIQSTRLLKRAKTGDDEVEYFEPAGGAVFPNAVLSLLAPYGQARRSFRSGFSNPGEGSIDFSLDRRKTL